MSEAEDVIIVEVSDYLDGALEGPEKAAIATKISNDPEYKRVHAEMVETRNALSGLQKARLPPTFAQDVTETIHKRSAGRFFARRTFGDRVPFSALLVLAVLGLIVIAYFLWASETGSLKVTPDHPSTEQNPEPVHTVK
jgi:anti-sigma factor RsiW